MQLTIGVSQLIDTEDPMHVQHKGFTYEYTGKSNLYHATAETVRKLVTSENARLCISLDYKKIWEA